MISTVVFIFTIGYLLYVVYTLNKRLNSVEADLKPLIVTHHVHQDGEVVPYLSFILNQADMQTFSFGDDDD